MSAAQKQRGANIDSRTWLFHLLIGVASIILIHSDKGGLCLFVWCILLHLVTQKAHNVPVYIFAYIVFTGFAWIGVQLLPNDNFYFLGLAFSNMGVLGRKAMIPLILRTTKVAEELSASMTVRGVRFSGETISYRPVRFAWRDAALCVVALLIPVIVFLLERRGIF